MHSYSETDIISCRSRLVGELIFRTPTEVRECGPSIASTPVIVALHLRSCNNRQSRTHRKHTRLRCRVVRAGRADRCS